MNEEELLKVIQVQIDELAQNSNDSCINGVQFEKGKWIQVSIVPLFDYDLAFKLLKLEGDKIIGTLWTKNRSKMSGEDIISYINDYEFPTIVLNSANEIDKPNWVGE